MFGLIIDFLITCTNFGTDGVTVDALVQAVDGVNAHRAGSGADTFVKIASSGYSFDAGASEPSPTDHDFVFRIVLHHQTPRQGCRLLVDTICEAVKFVRKS